MKFYIGVVKNPARIQTTDFNINFSFFLFVPRQVAEKAVCLMINMFLYLIQWNFHRIARFHRKF